MLLYAENYLVKHFDITSVTKIVVHKIGIFYQLGPFKLSFPYILYKIDNTGKWWGIYFYGYTFFQNADTFWIIRVSSQMLCKYAGMTFEYHNGVYFSSKKIFYLH